MRLLLIRHGETAHNAGRIAMGRQDVPLNERGLRQAQALAGELRSGRFGPVAAVYASPLQRARSTAQAIADALGLPVQVAPELIEMEIGEAEELSYAEIRERYPEFIRAWLSDGAADAPMPGGETLRQVQERAWAALTAIGERHAEETIAVVSHNFVILTLLCRILDLPLAQFRRLRQDVAAISWIELRPERQTLLALNDRCHLGSDR
jgi:broad specificity phosphatase PhoE